jgi:GMP synthase (glutamine-hydrolysing)
MTELVALQLHDDFPPGLLTPWARGRGMELCVVRADRGEPLPSPATAVAVVVLGAPGSLREEGPPSSGLAPLREWTAEALARDVPVLGIGFGAQVIAAILGAEIGLAVLPEPAEAVVVTDVPWLAPGPWPMRSRDFVVLPPTIPVLAYNGHGVQAFAVGPHIGVRFHPEAVTADRAGDARALFDGWAAGAGLDRRAAVGDREAAAA